MVSFDANVAKASSAYGLYGTITSKQLAEFIGTRVRITVKKIEE